MRLFAASSNQLSILYNIAATMYADEMDGSGDPTPWSTLGTSKSGVFESKETGIRVVVILTCVLSVLGSLMIVFSYVYFKQLRSKPREILLHISLMDFGVSLANLIGASVYFDRFYQTSFSNTSSLTLDDDNYDDVYTTESDHTFTAPSTIDGLCTAQAFFAGYFTLGSILWTIFLSIYIYIFLLYSNSKPNLPSCWSFIMSYLISYGVPFIVLLWLLLTQRLGYSPYNSSGWCSLIVQDPSTGDVDIYAVVFGNDLWIYLAIIIIPTLYFASHNYIHKNLDAVHKKQCRSLVYKFLLIPVVFLVLRIWTCILIILYTYIGLSQKQVPSWVNSILLYLSGIGDSGQGFANVILFVLFSKRVRKKLVRLLLCRRQIVDIDIPDVAVNSNTDKRGEDSTNLVPNEFEDTTHLLFESLDNTSLNIDIDRSSRVI